MAGGNAAAAAAHAALLLVLQIWECFIGEKYMKEADAGRCPTCNSPRTCKNYFCLQCKTGGLCPALFRIDNEHRDHPWLQVRHYSRQDSVLSTSLEHFMSEDGLKHIHTNKLNVEERHCFLKSKQVAGPSSSRLTQAQARPGGEKSCQGCMATLRGSKHSTETFLVCSLQCLLEVARNRPALKLLAMNDGAMDPMQPPLFYTEKLSESRSTPDPSTKTPVDEAPPSPPATGDFPMFETHEDLEGDAIIAALPFPLEIDNYPMFGTPAQASFGEALPFPPATEEFSMFGATVEASFGEALPVAPATEGSPMSERPEAPPAAPADAIQLMTFSLPPEFQALDFGPEWAEKMWLTS